MAQEVVGQSIQEASPRLPFKTFRIENIDSDTTDENLCEELVRECIGPVMHMSLAAVPDGKGKKTATVTIDAGKKTLAAGYRNIAGVYRRLDTAMLGFTPLSDAGGDEDYVEYVFIS